jgi:mono/diheme cytochrome c family protein
MKPIQTILIAAVAGLTFAATQPAHAAEGKAVWQKACAKCHGPDGKGDTPMGRRLEIRDLTDPKVQASFTDAIAVKDVKEGVTVDGRKKMPAYADTLTQAQIKDVVAYLRTFKKG